MSPEIKNSYLVVYDYGTGGVWAVINARSKDEIVRKYPQLEILETRPRWMTEQRYQEIASRLTFDIDTAPSDWLTQAVKEH